ncbi:MAG: undecaprenyl-diphosphate phosphatase [Vicinamibacteria bacterium]|nr:undecaprenyl-diphosphate phosphatase [Vicinamibacteria bacterium]
MNIFEAIILGVVQGAGEFLPISSSGHLIVVPWLMGWTEHSLAFDVALHLGTLVAVAAALLGDWVRMIQGALLSLKAHGNPFVSEDGRRLGFLAVASIPGGVFGLLLNDLAESTFRSALLVAATMSAMGLVLWLADARSPTSRGIEAWTFRDAMIMGFAQALALVPGVSRSGATISAARFLGYERNAAARLSFLMALPVTLGAVILKVPKMLAGGVEASLVAGIVTAALVGLVSIRVLFAWVRTGSYLPFVLYRFAFSSLVIAFWLFR